MRHGSRRSSEAAGRGGYLKVSHFFFFSYEVTSLKPDQRILEPEDQHRVYGVVDSARVRYAVSVSRQE